MGNLFFSFSGRISRQPWWLGLIGLAIVQWAVWFVLAMVLGLNITVDPTDQAAVAAMMGKIMVPIIILVLVFIYPTLAVYTKRWHDRGKSGWWSLIILIPVIGGIWALIELGFLGGTPGANQYGADPRVRSLATA